MSSESLTKLQQLLRDLFQFDLSDLDFGIYRLLRIKRDDIEAFLNDQLPRRVDEVFSGLAGEEQKKLKENVVELAAQIREEIDDDALSPTGEVKTEFKATRVRKARQLIDEYEQKRTLSRSVEATEDQKADVFNYLYAFFSRYYEDGDFIPKRRYGARETYAVPYNGEETYFHWANKDQHYVKTGENFHDYSFTVDVHGKTYRNRFALTQATIPPGNTKGDIRYFYPIPEEATFDESSLTFKLPFEYRLPIESEIEKVGKNSKLQEALLQDSLRSIFKAIPDEALRGALNQPVDGSDDERPSILLKRLRHFCKKNTTDFFVHRDLDGFLKRELEFYLKDQVVHLADIDTDFQSKRRALQVVRELASEVIQFLAQIENVQKRLYEKKKFVLRTDYLIPIQSVPRDFWKDVIANNKQLDDWKRLYTIDPKESLFSEKGKVNEHFLSENPTLVVNTSLFEKEFTQKLLATFEDVDAATDGILMKADNYQALKLIQRKYVGAIDSVHIDPPYNTQTSGFLYKNRYQHSSWLAMMQGRIRASLPLLSSEGSYLCHIDENEYELLHLLFSYEGLPDSGTVVWDKRNPMLGRRGIATQHEYVIYRSKSDESIYLRSLNIRTILSKVESLIKANKGVNEKGRKQFVEWINQQENFSGGEKAYKLIDDEGGVYRGVAMGAPEPRTDPKFFIPLVHPVTKKPCPVPPFGWSRKPETLKRLLERGEILFGDDEKVQPQRKVYLTAESKRQLSSVIADASRGKKDLDKLGLEFPYCHPVSLYEELQGASSSREGSVVLDYFAGSGTTAHAVINLNREDEGNRKFILAEIEDYFDSVLVPRIEKVIYSPEWSAGKPLRGANKDEAKYSPRIVKVLKLEGYEDCLHNVSTEEILTKETNVARAHKARIGEDEYRLRYFAKLPMNFNSALLDLNKLEHPFKYTIEVLTDDGGVSTTVDIVETFNLLYAIHVNQFSSWSNTKDKREYTVVKGKNQENRSILIVWRDMQDLDPKLEREFLESRLKSESTFDEMLINGDTATPGFISLDPIFKRLMEEEER